MNIHAFLTLCFEFIAPRDAFHQNSKGLFNCCGNVAEMVQEKGVSKGGSWASNQYQLMLNAKEYYDGPNCKTGFRIFMEIVEP